MRRLGHSAKRYGSSGFEERQYFDSFAHRDALLGILQYVIVYVLFALKDALLCFMLFALKDALLCVMLQYTR